MMKKLMTRLGAAAMALMLAGMCGLPEAMNGTRAAMAESRQASAAELLDSISTLIDLDFDGSKITIGYMLESAIGMCEPDSPGRALLQNAREMLSAENPDAASVGALITAARAILSMDEALPSVTPEPMAETPITVTPEPTAETLVEMTPEPVKETPEITLPPRHPVLPVYEASGFRTVALGSRVSMPVPSDWGGNAGNRAVVSWSPVNKSGAISPKAGTLTTAWLPREQASDEAQFDAYEYGLSTMSVNSDVVSVPYEVVGLPARRIRYRMSIGANQFDCEVVCFDDAEYLYTVGLVQGNKSPYDYFDLFEQVVRNLRLGDAGEDAVTLDATPSPDAVTPANPLPGGFMPGDDLSGFVYLRDGVRLTFPTAVSDFGASAIPDSPAAELGCDSSTADHLGGTQYYDYGDAMSREMIGITNLTGRSATLADSHVTALLDTVGGEIGIELPGGVRVGAAESAVYAGFPVFAETPIDGSGRFLNPNILYAAGQTERGDGSHGYVIIRNDAPMYSALSIICRDGVVVEIKLECLGQLQGREVFL